MVALLIKILPFLISFIIFFSFTASGTGDISAESAVVMNAETKEILYEKSAYELRSMASTTKIMTGILAIESGRLNESVTATDRIMSEGTSIGLKSGTVLSMKSLLYGMMLESGNDAANLCAVYLSGSVEKFADKMNEKALEIGMLDTNFVTPSGLDDEMHFTTAYDMALLGAYAVKNPVFREICSCEKKTVEYIKPEKSVTFYNHNRLLRECKGVFGIKTGFTKKSGRCLVTACKRGETTLICVTLKAYDDWNDHKKLYDYCFSDLTVKEYSDLKNNTVKIYGSEKNTFKIKRENYTYSFKKFKGDISEKIVLPEIIYAPVKENDIIGKILYISENIVIGSSNIYAAENVSSCNPDFKKDISFFERIKKIFSKTKGI